MKFLNQFRRKFIKISLTILLSIGIVFNHKVEGMILVFEALSADVAKALFYITAAEVIANSEQIKKSLKASVINIKNMILGGKTQEAINKSEQLVNTIQNNKPVNEEIYIGPKPNKVNIENHDLLSKNKLTNIKDQKCNNYFYSVCNDILINDNAGKSKDYTSIGTELFFSSGTIQFKPEQIHQIKEQTHKRLAHNFIQIGHFLRDMKRVYKNANMAIKAEDIADLEITRAAETNFIFANACVEAIEHANQVVIKAVSGDSSARVELNTITLPGSVGRAFDELVEKFNVEFFDKKGNLLHGTHPEKVSELLNAYYQVTSKTQAEYITNLERATNKNFMPLDNYISKAKSSEITIHSTNGFKRFIKKALPAFSSWGKIDKTLILNNKHNKILNEVRHLCNFETDSFDEYLQALKSAEQIIIKYGASGNAPYHSTMLNLFNGGKANLAKLRNPQKSKRDAEIVNLTPKVPTVIKTDKTEINSAGLPKVIPVKTQDIPDKGGKIVNPENQLIPGAAPVTVETNPASCGTGEQIVNIPEGLNFGPQTLPSLGDGMSLGESASPDIESANITAVPVVENKPNQEKPKVQELIPATETEINVEDKETKARTQSLIEELINSDQLSDKILGDEKNLAKLVEYAHEIIKLESKYDSEIIKTIINIPEFSLKRLINGNRTKLIAPTCEKLKIINSNPRWTKFIYDPANKKNIVYLKNIDEAMTGIYCEKHKLLKDLTRSPIAGEEFIDSLGQAWDVKDAKSTNYDGLYIFNLDNLIDSIIKEYPRNENVIVDVTLTEKFDLPILMLKLNSILTDDLKKRTIIIHQNDEILCRFLGK